MAEHRRITYNRKLRDIVTPKHLKETPIHNWLVFPHSYSYELIKLLKSKWQLNQADMILDPFCGAGTTLLAAKKLGLSAKGYDISPYAVFVSNAKSANYGITDLVACWEKIEKRLSRYRRARKIKEYSDLVLKALSLEVIEQFERIESIIAACSKSSLERDFFRLGLFSVMPLFSSAQATGGWLKWTPPRKSHSEVVSCYRERVHMMIEHVTHDDDSRLDNSASIGDIRFLPEPDDCYTAIITSPPYPNRHDYTRVFGVELMYGFLDWQGARGVRYQSLHSHPESKPIRPDCSSYVPPRQLTRALEKYQAVTINNRVLAMLKGYFLDLYCSLREMYRVCKKEANAALVLGNAQYNGVQFLVDEIVADIAEQVGFTCSEILTARIRGNSAQQMKIYGKQPSRESIIFLEK